MKVSGTENLRVANSGVDARKGTAGQGDHRKGRNSLAKGRGVLAGQPLYTKDGEEDQAGRDNDHVVWDKKHIERIEPHEEQNRHKERDTNSSLAVGAKG